MLVGTEGRCDGRENTFEFLRKHISVDSRLTQIRHLVNYVINPVRRKPLRGCYGILIDCIDFGGTHPTTALTQATRKNMLSTVDISLDRVGEAQLSTLAGLVDIVAYMWCQARANKELQLQTITEGVP